MPVQPLKFLLLLLQVFGDMSRHTYKHKNMLTNQNICLINRSFCYKNEFMILYQPWHCKLLNCILLFSMRLSEVTVQIVELTSITVSRFGTLVLRKLLVFLKFQKHFSRALEIVLGDYSNW